MISICCAIIILLAYIVCLCYRGGGVPSSLSATVFDLPVGWKWLWTIVIYAVCFLCVPYYVEVTEENTQFLAFIAIAALAFVGAAPLVKEKADLSYKVHCGAAVVCGVCSQVVLALNLPILLLLWPFWVAFLVFTHLQGNKWPTKTFWAEMVCFGSTFIYCLVR